MTHGASGDFPRLFSPLELRGRRLRNRIVSTAHKATMGEGGVPAERARHYYVERAAGGVGLIVTEPVPAHETAPATAAAFLADDDRLIPAFARLGEAMHAEGAAIVAQVHHIGAYADPLATMRERWGPTGLQRAGVGERVHGMSRAEIRELVAAFGRAAARIAAADLDGAEVLMAYDGLIDSFFSPALNHRRDNYGGPLFNRVRLAREVLLTVREQLGEDRILGFTVSGDARPSEGESIDEIAATLAHAAGVDYVGVGHGGYSRFRLTIPAMDVEAGFGAVTAKRMKAALSDVAVIAEGRMISPDLAERALTDGACDLVGMTRALIADPQLPEKARTGRVGEIRPCIGCNQQCWGRRSQQFFISCLQNPAVGLEGRYGVRRLGRAARSKRLVVIGGGPAGLEVARVAAERGHSVTLLDAGDALGGQALLAARLPHHAEFANVVGYRVRELRRLGVRTRLGLRATPADVLALEPDVAVLATGSVPEREGYQPALGATVMIDDAARRRVTTPAEVLAGAPIEDGPVVLLDGEGHRRSLGTAEVLASRGHPTTVVAADPFVGAGLAPIAALDGYMERLAALGVSLMPMAAVTRYDGAEVVTRSLYDGAQRAVPAATLVVSVPPLPELGLLEPLRSAGLEPMVIGDARAPRLMDAAIRDGHRAGWEM